MAHIQLRPTERYALVGKTRSGKTALAMVIAATFAMALMQSDPDWEVWWVDTKGDPKDLAALRKWGFRNAASKEDKETIGSLPNAFYFLIRNRENLSISDQVQALLAEAYKRHKVFIVIDEYAQVVVSQKNAGKALLDVFQRGGGINVGIMGLTQEPVYIPRQLLSQASHLVLLTLTYGHDIAYIKKMEPVYTPPIKIGDPYGFFWKHVDGTGEVTYYPNQKVWYDQLQVVLPNPVGSEPVSAA